MKIDDVNTLSNCKNLYYTGGCALNIQANSAIVESNLFENIFIPPCAEDSGLAIGAAAYGEWKKGNSFSRQNAYLNNWGVEDYNVEYTEADLKEVAELLVSKKIIGICNHHAEIGPRALGNRSLIALPKKSLAKKVSVELKKREWYRPVAPVMLEKNTKYFTGFEKIHHLSKYMLLDFPVLEQRQNEIAGVIHSNGTARIQTLFEKSENPFLFDLLTLLENQYNIKALINTSFNIQGEPIVHTTDDAIKSGKEMGLDALILNGKVKLL
jgi:carbamoyltransferase